jgi:hypothetical protein
VFQIPKNELDRVTEEKLARGGVLAKLYFDMRHNDKEKLQPLMVDLVNERLMKEPGVVYCYGAIDEPIESDGSFVTSGIITVMFESFIPLVSVAFRYAPAGVEIMKPHNEMRFKISELQSILMDISNISIEYSRYILEKVMKPDDMKQMEDHLKDREAIGKKLLQKKDNQSEPVS